MRCLLVPISSACLICLSLSIGRADDGPTRLPPVASRRIEFDIDVRPIFQKNCFSCHGDEHQEGGLRLDLKQRALVGGDSGAEIVAGKSAESRLIRVIAGIDEDIGQMPPEIKGQKLSAAEIGLLRAWIDQGAKWPDEYPGQANTNSHWSLQPIRRSSLPMTSNKLWPQQPPDVFIAARHEAERVSPSPTAERSTLLRRLLLDLVGLLPQADEIDEFINDLSPDSIERLVDRLLASPHFGERWGRHWLDLARYADSDGYEKDRPRPFAFKYRDWVIAALNADMPFDQFTVEQLAGDMLPNATLEQQVAVGLHRNTLHNTEGGTDQEEDRVKKTVDRTNTLGTVWLGMTVGCAQCHSHKYDPLTQREYYSLYAFFNSLEEKDIENPTPDQATAFKSAKEAYAKKLTQLETAVKKYIGEKLPATQTAWEKTLADMSAEKIAALKLPAEVSDALAKPVAERTPAEAGTITRHYRTIDKPLAALEKAVKDHKAKPPQLAAEAKSQSVAELVKPRETHIHQRGDFLSPGDVVSLGTPAFLPAAKPRGEQSDRLDLATWVVDAANPLPARVTVNRLWHQLFGRGIVPTLDDFGRQGEKPSHPELLDWLASEFVSSGWSQKTLIRHIILSAAYQQSSAPRGDLTDRDPENVLVARQVRRRVEAEVIRDLALTACGLLSDHIGGPSVRPPQPAEYAALTYQNSAKWVESSGADRYRRGLYTFFQRTSPYPMLMTFDSPDSNECSARRQTSNTPLQALTIWNDPAFFEAAQALGRRVVADVPAEDDAERTARLRANRAFLLCLNRQPSAAEASDVFTLYQATKELADRDAEAAAKLVGNPTPTSDSLAEIAAWITVGRTILNLDEFITRE